MAYRSCDSVPYAQSLRATLHGKQYSNPPLLHDVWWSSVQYPTSRCCEAGLCTHYRQDRLVHSDNTALDLCAARLHRHAHVVGPEVYVRPGDGLHGTGRALCVTTCVRKNRRGPLRRIHLTAFGTIGQWENALSLRRCRRHQHHSRHTLIVV